MNRAQRREKERSAKKYDKKVSFSKQEVESMNEQAYKLGVEHAVKAMKQEFGIGPKREERFKERLRWLQYEDFTLYMQEVRKG